MYSRAQCLDAYRRQGLVVPVIRNVEGMNYADIEKVIAELGEKVRTRLFTRPSMHVDRRRGINGCMLIRVTSSEKCACMGARRSSPARRIAFKVIDALGP